MARPQVVLDLAGAHQLARDLTAGGVFVAGCTLALFADCDLVVRAADGDLDRELVIAARVVFVNAGGAGLELVDCPAEQLQRLAELAMLPDRTRTIELPVTVDDATTAADALAAGTDDPVAGGDDPTAGADANANTADPDAAGDGTDKPASGARPFARNVHERLRGLTLVQQIKIAQHGEVAERIVLERIYSKTVWEPLLRNPRVTGPEVARIARMGALPRPMLELICNNGGWLQLPEIRRALLSNPRLATDQIMRVLRLVPKHELKLATIQTSYPHAVREVAKRLLRELQP